MFVQLKDWSQRKNRDQSVQRIIGRAMGPLSQIKEGMVFAFNIPPIPALGSSTGFNLFLQDQAGLGHEQLLAARNQLLGMACSGFEVDPGAPQRYGRQPPVQHRHRL
jgi:multidrug efflux pump